MLKPVLTMPKATIKSQATQPRRERANASV